MKDLRKNTSYSRIAAAESCAADLYFVDIDLAGDIQAQLQAHPLENAVPIFSYFGDWHGKNEQALSTFKQALDFCQNKASLVMLGLDNDSLLHQALSPRNAQALVEERVENIQEFMALLKEYGGAWGAALTVEELCPGGTDASDGIFIAQHLEQSGAQIIIASAGTKDFPALKWRRKPKIKNDANRFSSPESWLASAAWLVGKVQVPVLADGVPDDLDTALKYAEQLGIYGLSQK